MNTFDDAVLIGSTVSVATRCHRSANRHSLSGSTDSEAMLAERAAIKPRRAHEIAGRQLGTRMGDKGAADRFWIFPNIWG